MVKNHKVDLEAKSKNTKGNNNKRNNSGTPMGEVGLNRHLGVAKLDPQISNSVDTNHSGNKETNHLDTADTAN